MDFDLAAAVSSSSGRATRRNVSAKRGHLSLPRTQSPPTATLPSQQQQDRKKKDALRSISNRQSHINDTSRHGLDRHARRASSVPSSDAEADQVGNESASHELRSGRNKRAPKRRLLENGHAKLTNGVAGSDEESIHDARKRTSKQSQRKNKASEVWPRPPIEIERIDGIPRIRLLNPANLPRPPRYGRSLARYLQSWHTTGYYVGGNGELEVVSSEELRMRNEKDAALYCRIDELRAEGLLQSREEALRKSTQSRTREPQRGQTPWDVILTQIGTAATRTRADVRTKVAISKRVARMVQQYWDEKLGRGEKQRKAEERRVRQLAKWTVREVRKQWKLAVNVIRSQRQAREKAEKDRLGREQLNSILEQSTQMLGRHQRALVEMGEQVHDGEDEGVSVDDNESDNESDDESSSGGESQGSEEDAASVASSDADSEAVSDEADEADAVEQSRLTIDDPDESEIRNAQDVRGSSGSADESASPARSLFTDPNLVSRDSTEALHVKAQANGIEHSDIIMSEEKENGWRSDEELRPVRTTRRLDPSLLKDAAQKRSAGHDAEDDDVDFESTDDVRQQEDVELERQMWEQDASDSDDDASLAADAEMPIEELMKKYGYQDAASTTSADPQEEKEKHFSDGGSDRKDAGLEFDAYEGSDEGTPKGVELYKDHESSDVESNTHAEPSAVSLRRSRSQTLTSTLVAERSSIKVKPPFLLRGSLRPYQQIGFEWLVNLYNNHSNGILADEMGLGKTIQTIALLGHLACDKGVWGPHLVVAPTSVMLNWEVEFKKFFPGFKVLSYYGSQKERKEKRKGWNTENSFNICITSYQLVLADQHILRRKPWQYLVLDEAHHIKNFRSQRWQTLLGFNSRRRLLLTGTPLQNNLMDLWSLMYFLMPNGVTNAQGIVSSGFASMKEFQQWFSNPLDKAVESAGVNTASEEMDVETRGMVSKLHTLLRPYLLRRLKSEVERELPNKYEHVIKCRLSKRQQFLYNDFMSRAKTRESLASGNYLSIINCLMQLRKVCNHPDLFEERPILTSFAMSRSVAADFEIKDLLVRRNLLENTDPFKYVDLQTLNLQTNSGDRQHLSPIVTRALRKLDASDRLPHIKEPEISSVLIDTSSIDAYKLSKAQFDHAEKVAGWRHAAYLNKLRCASTAPTLCDSESLQVIRSAGAHSKLLPYSIVKGDSRNFLDRCDAVHRAILTYEDRRATVQTFVDRFAFAPPRAVAVDVPRWAVPELSYEIAPKRLLDPDFDTLHAPAVKLQIAFPDASLLQYDCGKLQALAKLMERCKNGQHRILIFTQMTKVLDILEKWLNFNGFNYLRLDGATKIEDRQALTEKFNRDERIKAFILSTRSGGLGINLTGADTVLFWDLDWNFQIEAQCMDRAHRIGQTRDVHIYRFVSEHTIEENMLKKSQEKRLLDAMVIQDGQFTTEGLSKMSWIESMFDEGGRSIAGVQVGGADGDAVPLAAKGATRLTNGTRGTSSSAAPTNDRSIEQAMDAAEDEEDAQAARTARAELHVADDDFADEMGMRNEDNPATAAQQARTEGAHVAAMPSDEKTAAASSAAQRQDTLNINDGGYQGSDGDGDGDDDEGGTIDDYMLRRVDADWDYFGAL